MKSFIKIIATFAFLFFVGSVSAQWSSNGNDIYNTNTGNVGIGDGSSWSPSYLLDVAKTMTEPTIAVRNTGSNGGATFRMIDANSGADYKFKSTFFGGFKIRDNANSLDVITIEANSGHQAFNIVAGGGIGIGTTSVPSGYKLAIDGKVIAEELEVQLSTNWPDYVFNDSYELMSLSELESFIKKNNHLPGVPSQKELEESTINLGEMDAILLEKIEELTLYMLELKKENEILKKEINAIKSIK